MALHVELARYVKAFHHARVLCVGDSMIDHYINGNVDRISPEGPVPLLQIESEERKLGGAANVLHNLHALGVGTCFISMIGCDQAGSDLIQMVSELEIAEPHLLSEHGRVTTVKTRCVAGIQQLLRADRERITPLRQELFDECISLVRDFLASYRFVIVSDYAKGMFANGLAHEIISASRQAGVTTIVDPKNSDFGAYRGASILKPNRRELAAAAGRSLETEDDIVDAARSLIKAHDITSMLVTCGKDGMLLVEGSGAAHRLRAEAREVYDVSGAGDTVAAVLGASLAAGASLLEAAQLANTAAGIVVGKLGTAVVSAQELAQALVHRNAVDHQKVLPLDLALNAIERWRDTGLSVGFTNGCFDLLHPGHVSLLRQARAGCDRLVVGLNSDASASRLKGPGRPVQAAEARAAVLASVESVDLVIVFEDDTPLPLIEVIRPDLLVKGADYRGGEVVGDSTVEAYGGTVMFAELLPGYSTTDTIARARA